MSKEQIAFLTSSAVGDKVNTLSSAVSTLQGQVTTLESGQNCGQYFRHTNQTISTTGAPSTVSINWSGSTSWTDLLTITQNVPSGANFTVNQRGVYRLDFQVLYNNLSSATFTDRSLRIYIGLIHGGTTALISQANIDLADNVPNNAGVSTGCLFELNVGDQLFFQTSQYLSAGSFTVSGHSTAPADFDLNTYWSWVLVKPLL